MMVMRVLRVYWQRSDLDNPSPETITEFRIDLSAYPEGSFCCVNID